MLYKVVVLLALSVCILGKNAYANLLISPTRISFDERQRTAKVTVINTGDEYQTYRVLWSEKQAQPSGGYIQLAEATSESLSSMARLSPKQMRLAPGEKQTVKIAIRKPKGLAPGEYRSHLLFQALPGENTNKTSSIKVNMIMSYSIPILLRKDMKQPEVAIEQAQLVLNESNQRPQFLLNIKREGKFSSYGKLSAYFFDSNNEQVKIAEIGNLSIYPEVDNAFVTLSLFSDKNLDKAGKVIFKYEGSQEYKDLTFAQYTLPLTSQSLNVLTVNDAK
ncbi:fimbrial biogenesis chaperone [Pseudoalteromonas arctica]|uniref:Fimbria/pilus periplasmic chaperone n=1 Tax=Pseudoalteromonas arctica TaxID=394751 RepID=A0ABU9TDD1_9GAMM